MSSKKEFLIMKASKFRNMLQLNINEKNSKSLSLKSKVYYIRIIIMNILAHQCIYNKGRIRLCLLQRPLIKNLQNTKNQAHKDKTFRQAEIASARLEHYWSSKPD